MSTPKSKTPLKVGVLMCPGAIQLLDVSPVDILGMIEPSYLSACQLPETIINQGVPIEYHYVTEDGKGPVQMTGGMKTVVSDSIRTCPSLNIILVTAAPHYKPSPEMVAFIHEQLASVTAFMSICAGFQAVLHAGILNNKTATAPRALLPYLEKQAPAVNWVDRRYVKDGKVWSSGGVTNGLDMMAAFMRETFGKELVELVLDIADVGERGEAYAGPSKWDPELFAGLAPNSN